MKTRMPVKSAQTSLRLKRSGILLVCLAATLWAFTGIFWQMLVMSLFGAGALQLTFFLAIESSNAATATVLQYISPAIVVLYLAIRHRKMPRAVDIICVLLAIVGIVLIATHGNFTSLALSPAALFWGAASAFSMSFYTIYPKDLYQKLGYVFTLGFSMLLSGIALSLFVHPWTVSLSGMTAELWFYLFYIVCIGTIFPFLAYSKGVSYIGGTLSNVLAALEPLISCVAAVILFNTVFTAFDLLGFALVLGSSVALSLVSN